MLNGIEEGRRSNVYWPIAAFEWVIEVPRNEQAPSGDLSSQVRVDVDGQMIESFAGRGKVRQEIMNKILVARF